MLRHYQLGRLGILLPSLKPNLPDEEVIHEQEEIEDTVLLHRDLVKVNFFYHNHTSDLIVTTHT